jgi:hypothetical protein
MVNLATSISLDFVFFLVFYLFSVQPSVIISQLRICSQGAFGSAVQPAFRRISNFFFFFFAKIECGLYLLDRFDVLISKMIFKK